MALNIKSEVTAIVYDKLKGFIPFAESLGRSRFLVYESEVHAPDESELAREKEDTEMEAIAESFRCDIKQAGEHFSLFFYMEERNPGGFLEIVDAGMPPPLVGGDNGIAHEPDGSTYKSKAPIAQWGQPLDGNGKPDYSKEGTGVIKEIKTMLKSLFHDYFNDAVKEARTEILTLAKQEVQSRIHNALGGS